VRACAVQLFALVQDHGLAVDSDRLLYVYYAFDFLSVKQRAYSIAFNSLLSALVQVFASRRLISWASGQAGVSINREINMRALSKRIDPIAEIIVSRLMQINQLKRSNTCAVL